MKTIICYDTETTGLLLPEANEISEQPHIIEIYCGKFNEDGNLIDEFQSYLKPPIELPAIITKITGITESDLRDAKTFVEVYEDMADFFTGANILSAHNIGFDRNMLANELLRIDRILQFPWPKTHICTVQSSKHLEGHRLSLTKLHTYLFGCEFQGAHRAKSDVVAQSKCLFELVKRGDIRL